MTAPDKAIAPAALQQLQAGLEAHRRGALADAERLYRAVLAVAPEALDACNLLGRLLVQLGRAGEAVGLLRHAIDRAPGQLGLWLSYTESLLAQGDIVAAREAAEHARQLAPQDGEALFAWAEVQRRAGAWEMAAGGYRHLLALQAGHAGAWLQLATCLQALQDTAGAFAAAEQALRHAPQAPECHNNLGSLRAAQGDFAVAIASFDQALRLRPHYPPALINKAAALRETGHMADALALAEQAVQLSHGHPDAWAAVAQVHHVDGRLQPALTAYRAALAQKPQDAELQWNYGLAALAAGDGATGWPAFAWRWRKAAPPLPRRSWPWPAWPAGADPRDKQLLLWGEQGIGDRLLYLQMLPGLLAAGARVTLETDPRLIPLLQRAFPTLRCHAEAAVPSPALLAESFDGHLATGDLGGRYAPAGPYLRADAERSAQLRGRYEDGSRLIGLSWRSINAAVGAQKSLDVAQLVPLAAIAGCRFVVVQYGATDAELATLRQIFGTRLVVDPAIDAQTDLDGLAAQLAALDLTITVSNATAHLAGALGRPVWTLAPAGKAQFFYLTAAGERTPWYPTMRIFRQTTPGAWDAVLQTVARELESLEKQASGC